MLFDMRIIQLALGGLYCIFEGMFCLSKLGFLVRRKRRLTLLVRRDIMVEILCPWDVFIASCTRVCTASWKEFLIGSDEELSNHYAWRINRK